jgi:hypothetical protein
MLAAETRRALPALNPLHPLHKGLIGGISAGQRFFEGCNGLSANPLQPLAGALAGVGTPGTRRSPGRT